jgi:uncharacterized protein YpmS
MDTLIDNRNFPPEMQQTPEFKKEGKTTPWLLILLVIFAVGIIVFLVCNIFFNNQKDIINKTTKSSNLEKKVETVNSFNKTIPSMTKEQRDDAMYSFFNSK